MGADRIDHFVQAEGDRRGSEAQRALEVAARECVATGVVRHPAGHLGQSGRRREDIRCAAEELQSDNDVPRAREALRMLVDDGLATQLSDRVGVSRAALRYDALSPVEAQARRRVVSDRRWEGTVMTERRPASQSARAPVGTRARRPGRLS
jgi:hypothetical protein